ncbi:Rec8 like protein-domain-containing protein [Gorgonomyces haynaldii]|nr:Rec8 like protein-domain-containing protein [Gorgonomyces haynaldii]
MFFSDQVMGKGGPLSAIWLASHWEKKVSKSQFLLTNIESSVHAIVDTNEPIAIRVSGQLLLGVVKIYSKKAKYLLEDCGEALVKIKMAFRSGQVDLNLEQQVVSASAITMHENMNEFDILLPEPGFTRPLVPKEDVTMIDTFLPSFQEEVGRDQSLEPQIGRDAPETSFLQLETPQKPQDPLLFEEGAVDFGFDQMDAPIEESFQMDIDQPG